MKFFITIKNNSKRVKQKNFQKLNELPLWKHLIHELHEHNVFVDTDSDLIYNECKNMDWVTPYLRKQKFIDMENSSLSTKTPTLGMIEYFLDTFVKDENEIIITTHVTSPFLKAKTMLDATNYLNKGYDSVQSVTRHQGPLWLGEDMKPTNFDPLIVKRTQDLPIITLSNGGFFIFKKKTFKEFYNRVGKNPYYYELPSPEDIEIDTYNDLNLAKLVAQGLKNK